MVLPTFLLPALYPVRSANDKHFIFARGRNSRGMACTAVVGADSGGDDVAMRLYPFPRRRALSMMCASGVSRAR